MKIKKSLFILISIILVSTSLSGCVKKQSPSKENQEEKSESIVPGDWQTYENNARKFSFSYPKEWNFNISADSDRVFEAVLELEDQSQEKTTFWDGQVGFPYYSIVLRVENNPENLSVLDWNVKQYLPQSREEMKEKYEKIVIGGHEGAKETGPITPPGSGNMTNFSFTPGNGKAYSFTYSAYAYEETHEKYLDDLKLILESMEFEN